MIRDVIDALMTRGGHSRGDAAALIARHRDRVETDLADGRRPRDIADAIAWADMPPERKAELIRHAREVY